MLDIKPRGLEEIPRKEIDNYFNMEEVKLYPIKPGDIILFNDHKKELYNDLQKDVQGVRGTEFELTHSAIGWFDLNQLEINIKGEQQIYEAKEAMTVTFWDKQIYDPYMEFWVYRFINVPQEVLSRVAYTVKRKTDGDTYGFLQILYFEREAFYKRNFIGKLIYPIAKLLHEGKEIERWGNWFPDGEICSEITYRMLIGVALEMNLELLLEYLYRWNQNNISPVGIKKIINNFRNDIQLIHYKKNTLKGI